MSGSPARVAAIRAAKRVSLQARELAAYLAGEPGSPMLAPAAMAEEHQELDYLSEVLRTALEALRAEVESR